MTVDGQDEWRRHVERIESLIGQATTTPVLCPKCALPACMHTAGADDRAEMLGEDK